VARVARGPKFVQYFDPVLQALKQLGGSARPGEVVKELYPKAWAARKDKIVFKRDTITSDHNVQLVKVGINYRFNWGGPVVARY